MQHVNDCGINSWTPENIDLWTPVYPSALAFRWEDAQRDRLLRVILCVDLAP